MEKTNQERAALFRNLPAMYRRPGDQVFKALIVGLTSSIILLALGMAVILWIEASPSWETYGYWNFLASTNWDPVKALHGALPFILGTVLTSFGALLLSVLPAIGVAIFVSEYAPKWLATIVNYIVDLLAAIPSVVIGLWAIFNFAPQIRDALYNPIVEWAQVSAPWLVDILGTPSTYNLATATIILALMIMPYTIALSRDAIRLVPKEQKEAAWALGATRWEVMKMAVLPYARSGIMAGILLSLARALGETMAVAMLIGNSNRVPFTLFGPAATMPSLIINEFREAVEPLHFTSIMGVGFYLFLITIGINLLASFVQKKLAIKRSAL